MNQLTIKRFQLNRMLNACDFLQSRRVDVETLSVLLLVAKLQPVREVTIRESYGFSNSKLNKTVQFLRGESPTKSYHDTECKKIDALIFRDDSFHYSVTDKGQDFLVEYFRLYEK